MPPLITLLDPSSCHEKCFYEQCPRCLGLFPLSLIGAHLRNAHRNSKSAKAENNSNTALKVSMRRLFVAAEVRYDVPAARGRNTTTEQPSINQINLGMNRFNQIVQSSSQRPRQILPHPHVIQQQQHNPTTVFGPTTVAIRPRTVEFVSAVPFLPRYNAMTRMKPSILSSGARPHLYTPQPSQPQRSTPKDTFASVNRIEIQDVKPLDLDLQLAAAAAAPSTSSKSQSQSGQRSVLTPPAPSPSMPAIRIERDELTDGSEDGENTTDSSENNDGSQPAAKRQKLEESPNDAGDEKPSTSGDGDQAPTLSSMIKVTTEKGSHSVSPPPTLGAVISPANRPQSPVPLFPRARTTEQRAEPAACNGHGEKVKSE